MSLTMQFCRLCSMVCLSIHIYIFYLTLRRHIRFIIFNNVNVKLIYLQKKIKGLKYHGSLKFYEKFN